jgi:flagellar basal-body rod protein FlgF
MIQGLYQSAGGMLTQMENHQVIAENLAASSVPGHRKSVVSFETYLSHKPQPPKITSQPEVPPYQVPHHEAYAKWAITSPSIRATTDFSAGRLEKDGHPTHFAINGNGFFAVELPGSKTTAYTRNGSFTVSETGELLTENGAKLLGNNGQPVRIRANALLNANEQGELMQEGVAVGKIQLATFQNPTKDLQWVGGRYFIPQGDAVAGPADPDARIVHGFLESSNVNSVKEMVSMIHAARMYEANQKALQAQDGSLEQSIRQIVAR